MQGDMFIVRFSFNHKHRLIFHISHTALHHKQLELEPVSSVGANVPWQQIVSVD